MTIDYTDPKLMHLIDESLLEGIQTCYLGHVEIGDVAHPVPVFLGRHEWQWTVSMRLGDMDLRYLNTNGLWRYKQGSCWPTRRQAIDAYAEWLVRFLTPVAAPERSAGILWLDDEGERAHAAG
jgi:hypothetical protein